MAALASLRSLLSFVAVVLWLLGPGTLMLYLGVLPFAWLAPRRRRGAVSAYMRLMSRGFLWLLRLGGARFERAGTVCTAEPGLVVMNHQSLLDIVTLTLLCWPQAPAFVTRRRYAVGIPAVSTCVRMTGSPVVDPERDPRAAVDELRRRAPELRHGVVLFPEGHRSRNGAVRPFKAAGAQALLEGQAMPVWVVATDGLWSSPRLVDFVFNIHRIHARTEVIERLPPATGAETPALLERARAAIVARIEELRAGTDLVPRALVEAVRARVQGSAGGDAPRAAKALAEAGGGEVEAVVFFGSRKSGARPGPGSAYDFFVVTASERRFYRALADAKLVRRSPRLLAVLGRVLAPTSISLTLPGEDGPLRAKCSVMTRRAFERDTSRRRRDHFTLGRLFQRTEVLYARDGTAREAVMRALARAHALAYEWARPWLPPQFDVDAFTRTLLRVSFAGEVRPEPAGPRVETLWAAQQGYLREVYGVLLGELARRGDLREVARGAYAPTRPVGTWERACLRGYFRWSMLRATARWAKHVATFEGWLDFLVGKARRHGGQEVVLTERERRAPLLFLWPRVWRYLRHKDR